MSDSEQKSQSAPRIVLKFGGTSISSVANWRNVASVLRQRLADGFAPLVVHSALSGVTDQLERLLDLALSGEWREVMEQIELRHRNLAAELGIQIPADVQSTFDRLRQFASGIALVGEVSDRLRARVLAQGELLATRLGAAFLAYEGFVVEWIDARTVLKAEQLPGARARASYLSAACNFAPDSTLIERWSAPGVVRITQGFIASDDKGDTVLLGRGGSDTSAAYFAAKLLAQRLEIWTDVPGMFSANPRAIPAARLLVALEYDEAQEIATNGAKVLHPRCILPVKRYGIPLHVFATQHPELAGTVVSAHGADGAARVKAICLKKGITLLSMETVGMWHSVGFLADAFAVFKQHGLSVDLVSTSETNVTVSLDPAANTLEPAAVDALAQDLERICRVRVIGPCAAVSLVGRNIRAILHQLGDALELFEEQKIYLVSQAANDLNLTFVIDEEQGDRLVQRLHELTIRKTAGDRVLGPTWEQIFGTVVSLPPGPTPWWERRRAELLEIGAREDAAYVYDRETLVEAAAALRSLSAVDRVLYAIKANPHPEVLRILHAQGVDFECVSRGEIERVREALPGLAAEQTLFTPNFAPREEYEWALMQGIPTTLDNLHPLRQWPELFRGRDVFVRIDTGYGRGHHDHVRTAGVHSKFGVPMFELDDLVALTSSAGARVVGLHAHTGSGIFAVENWREVGEMLASLGERFPEIRVLDLGGGLGVPERPGHPPLDLQALNCALAALKTAHPSFELWLEPGRYLVARAGVLLARVTQLKGKGDVRYVGVATGMNSLIRPALYGAYHEIVNLTRLEEPGSELVNVVGPICESGDQLGHERLLPATREGDVLLIANAGAYGHAMSSRYNLREPAGEIII